MRGSIFLALATATALTPNPVAAQTVLMVYGRTNVTTVSGRELENPNSRVGLNLGVSASFPKTESLGFRIGAAYSQKGVAERAEGLSATVALDYLEVPALLTVRVPSQGTLGAQLFLGPALSFEVDCHVSGSDGGSGISTGCKGLDLDTRTVDIGAVEGFGLRVSPILS